MRWFFVTGFDPKTGPNDIKDFLVKKGLDRSCVCEQIRTRRDRFCSSFKIGVMSDLRDRVMDADLWPCGVSVNHFLNLQRRRSLGREEMGSG